MTAQDALYSLIGVWDNAPLGDSNKSGTSSMPLDPELDDWTQFDNGTWGYDLLAGSPAVDAGDNTNAPVTDRPGFARIVDGNGEGVSQIDMGAIEYLSDAALPVLSIGNVTQTEGDSGTKTFTFTVSLSGTNTLGASVSYATADGTATAGSDYVASNGMLSWPAGDTSRKTISVTVNGDTTVEPDEGFTVTLSAASGNTQIITPTATGTVLNDDNQPPTVEANPTSVTTDAALATAVTFTAAATGTRLRR